MTRVATSRLREAMASLPPADRALVNLWVNRGLDDAALAGLLGMSENTIASRRARIIEHLSATLGLPPDHVHAALSEITVAPGSDNADAGVPGPSVDQAAAATTAAEPEAVAAPRRRRRVRWWWLALTLVAIAAVCILVASLAFGGPGSRRRPMASGASTPTVPAPRGGSATGRSGGDLLSALPGTSGHASGSVAASRGPRLSLTVRNLAPASDGHYEVWLYNSLTNSWPLARLPAGVDHLSLSLPRGAAHYRWIDISLQPVGTVFHSGESLLRAANPRFGRSGP